MEILQVVAASTIVAGLPAFAALAFIWWLDRYEKEPIRLIVVALLWGAIPTIVLSVLAQSALDVPLAALGNGLLKDLVDNSVVAPLTEEGFKALMLVALFLFRRTEFDGPMDGILYGAAIGFGFSVVEDVFYLVGAFGQSGWKGWGDLAILRVGLFTLNHSLFTACTGIGLGLARISRGFFRRTFLILAGFATAVFLHGTHNAGAALGGASEGASILVSIFVDWVGVLVVFVLALVFVQREKRRFVELLPEVEAGTLTQAEYDVASRYRSRCAAGLRIFFGKGPFAWLRWHRFVEAVVTLAFRKHSARLVGDEAPERIAAALDKQRARIRSLRPA